MQYRQLGRTGLFVSALSLGTMTFGGEGIFKVMGTLGQEQAQELIARALEAGVNLIDTADAYSAGRAESLTGEALRALNVPRHEVLVASKVFSSMGRGPNSGGLSRGHIFDGIEASLERLQLDYLDLYQVHAFDPATPILETLRALDDLVRQGLVRYIGVSNWSAWQLMKAIGLSERLGLTRVEACQSYYSLVGRDVEHELLPCLESEGVGMLVWSPLAGGFLTGKYSGDALDAQSRRRSLSFPPVDGIQGDAVIEVMRPIAAAHGVSLAQIALAWLLSQPQVSSVVIGARNLEQLNDNLEAAKLKLSAQELEALASVSAPAQAYPGWMHAVMGDTRRALLASRHT